MRNSIVFIGEENRTNNELYQLLNWRFKVLYYRSLEDISIEELRGENPSLVLVSMIGNNDNYHELFEYLSGNCADIPVAVINTAAESIRYEKFYEKEQFHKIMRPITGRKILEICRSIIGGKAYTGEEEQGKAVSDEKAHILVVDDNAMVLRNIKGIFQKSGV